MKKILPSFYFPAVKVLAHFKVCTISLCFLISGANAQSQLLKDINHSEDISHNEFSSLTDGENKIYLIVNNELWKTTGNDGGTVRLKTFKSIRNLAAIGSTAFFTADDGTGPELWKSTGTSGSTVKVKDMVPGTGGGNPELLTNVNGTLYFVAYTPANGRELWKTDGTESGTQLVKDILRVKGSSNPASLTNVNGTLYFAANDGQNGYEIWKSDGTANGTHMVVDVRPGNLSSTPEFLTNVNGTLYFVANDGTYGRELWKTDGTAAGSMRLKDIRSGSASPLIDNMTAVNNTLFFTANDGIHGFELWKSDGSGQNTELVKDMTPGPAGSHGEQVFTHQMGNFTNVFGLLYYTAYENDTYRIWKSNGTESGTIPVQTAFHGINTPSPRFVPKGSYIYYFNSIPDEFSDNRFHLYRMNPDGSNQVIITELFQEDFYSSYNPELIAFKNTLYFNARTTSGEGFQLYRSDGTPGSKILVKDPYQPTLGSDPSSMVKTGNNKIFFMAYEEIYNYSPGLWTTNGTPEGTVKLKDIGGGLNDIVATSTHVYFSVNYGLEIWKSDGTIGGTVLVKSDPTISQAYNLVNVNDVVYFRTYNGGLWRTDGSQSGTVSIPNTDGLGHMIAAGNKLYFTLNRGYSTELWRTNDMDMGISEVYTFQAQAQSYNWPVAVSGSILYFVANEGLTGNEVWRTDGTSAGTYQVADLHSADDNESDISSLEVWDDHLYIGAFDDTRNWALYKSDGTRGNALKVVDLPHPVVDMIPVNDRMHFFSSATEDEWRVNNWVTDGTAEGTKVISVAFYFSVYSDYVIVNNILYYAANGGLSRSDGTSCGTFELNLGVYGSDPLENIGNVLVFSGYTPLSGHEPYSFNLVKVPQSSCGTMMMARTKTSMESLMAAPEEGTAIPYPNPFAHDFSFRVNGVDNEFVDVDVFTGTGYPVEKFSGLKANTDYQLGHSWSPGLYILNIKTSGKIIAQKILKK